MVGEELKRYVTVWKRAAAACEEVAAQTPIDTQAAVAQLMPVFALARQAEPRTTTSGMVEMQRIFRRIHTRG